MRIMFNLKLSVYLLLIYGYLQNDVLTGILLQYFIYVNFVYAGCVV